ncbi:MAG: DUF86 domain-containing protein [Armatimonadetes bacterium]|nr:DUF86 domain-containing protein [Armatimonadota bacterium]
MKKDDLVYLKHIFDAINQIEEYVENIEYERFSTNRMIQDAVIREIEIIGEATKRLSMEIREKYSDIPWKKVTGMRDKLIHDYFGIDFDAVWGTATKDVSDLKKRIKKAIDMEEKS